MNDPSPAHLMSALVKTLPTPGTPLSEVERARWLTAARHMLEFLYDEPEAGGEDGAPPA